MKIEISDDLSSDILQYFSQTNSFIESSKGGVLVHCKMGISRSASIVLAYMIYSDWSYEKAFKHVQEKRPIVKPNRSFVTQLLKYEYSDRLL